MLDRGGSGLISDRFTPARLIPALALSTALLAACTNGIEEVTPTGGASLGQPTPPDCSPRPLDPATPVPADPVEATLALSLLVYPTCADLVVVSDIAHLDLAVDQALASGAPIVLVEPTDPTADPDTANPETGDTASRENDSADATGADATGADATGADPAAAAAAELARLDPGVALWVGLPDDRAAVEARAGIELSQAIAPAADAAPLGLAGAPLAQPGTQVWVAGPDQATALLASLPSIAAGGGTTRLLTGFTPDAIATDLAGIDPLAITLVDGTSATDRWRIELALAGTTLPGGGTTLFPDRRIIAFYGSPVTFRLGLLGEQGPQATIDRLRTVVDSYRIADEVLIPGFELIATVADSQAGDDGNYSKELDPEALREWIDIAAANDVYVIIDLQPGRTDFLTQAKIYEEFLRMPNVGLALDPEWRIGPDDVHLVKVGTVDAAEVNTVVDYLLGLVREEKLPQKALVLHQFQTAMITNRELIQTPPELAVVIHVDGQGPLGTKYGTYDTMLGAPIGPDQALWWGWKNFLDEDTPMATPEQTNAVTPLPVIVTFQ